ncbi:ion channel [Solidesulfovibrio sp.]|uniref:ion channel n=1 Tax=Solidesulfovibrio sp. TaxID=2910990 RepID=UPI002B1F867B|nr:ion channel [Solidesulfovibrio sp.]MEA4855939.1 ion channel [Solidesulfovibrio sp.]
MDRLLFLAAAQASDRPVLAAIAANRHSLALGLIIAAHLLLAGLPQGRAALFVPMLLLVMYLAGFLLLSQRNVFSLSILGVGVLALGATVASVYSETKPLVVLALCLHGSFDFLLILFMLIWLFRQRRMPFDNIMAGVIVLMFMAGLWAQLFALANIATPGAMRGPDGPLGPHPSITLYYFSVVTLSTAGFGDIVPVSDVARLLAAYEAMVGQVYLAVFIALLMGRQFAAHVTNTLGPPPAPGRPPALGAPPAPGTPHAAPPVSRAPAAGGEAANSGA